MHGASYCPWFLFVYQKCLKKRRPQMNAFNKYLHLIAKINLTKNREEIAKIDFSGI